MTLRADIEKIFEGSPHTYIHGSDATLSLFFIESYMATIYANKKRAEFYRFFDNPSGFGPRLRELVSYLKKEGYTTNLE